MLENLEQLFSVLRRITLTERERQNIRIHLQSHMREYPLQQNASQRVYSGIANLLASFERSLNSQIFLTHPAFAAFVLVLCVSIGTSYAAQRALPGESLYSFKTHVNERIEGALAFSPVAKAQWSAELTNRRLLEAEELVATGGLSPVAKADIETGLNVAVKNFNSNLTLLSAKDDLGAANAQSDLEASLNAHETVLSSLHLNSKGKNDSDTIVSLVRFHAEQISKDRSVVEATFTATDSPMVRSAALTQKESAEKAIQRVKLFSQQSLDTQVASSASSIAAEAEGDLQAGNSDAEKGNWGRAYGAFQDAIRKVKETEDSVDTRSWLKTKFGIGVEVVATTTAEKISNDTNDDKKDTDDNSSGKGKGDKKDRDNDSDR